MSRHVDYCAVAKIKPSLPAVKVSALCPEFLFYDCRNANCPFSHKFALLELIEMTESTKAKVESDAVNILRSATRAGYDGLPPESFLDLPGDQSASGPRHDNDFQSIEDMNVLSTTDEILAKRPPYLPLKDACLEVGAGSQEAGVRCFASALFRHLRYDALESVNDAAHTGLQLVMRHRNRVPTGADPFRQETARGVAFSLFLGVVVEQIVFHEHAGAAVEVSFACPGLMKGPGFKESATLEPGMLASLLTFNRVTKEVGNVFVQTVERLPNTDREDKSRVGVVVSFADPGDIAKVRELLYACRVYPTDLVIGLVDYGSVLHAGFVHHLKRLKQLSSGQGATVASSIGPLARLLLARKEMLLQLQPPAYASRTGFKWDLGVLKKAPLTDGAPFLLQTEDDSAAVREIMARTTLDEGQSRALYNNLTAEMSFTQGPPGTGKSFLAIATARVLIESVKREARGPLLVVTQTNHSLDDTLEALLAQGVDQVARAGSASKSAALTEHHLIKVLSARRKLDPVERRAKAAARKMLAAKTEVGENLAAAWSENEGLVSRVAGLSLDDGSLDDAVVQTRGWREFAEDATSTSTTTTTTATRTSRVPRPGTSAVPAYVVTQREIRAAAKASKDRKLREREQFLALSSEQQCDYFAENHRRYMTAKQAALDALDTIDYNTLKEMDVVGFTSTAVASLHSLLLKLEPRILILEEASELTEAHTLCAMLPSLQHVIAIGDPRQLRPHITERVLTAERSDNFRFDESLFERLVKVDYPFAKLNIQRRAHPDLARLIQATDYSFVKSHPSTQQREPVRGMVNRMQWLNHVFEETLSSVGEGLDNKSWANMFEADYIVQMVTWLIESQRYHIQDITVLTPYNGQLKAIERRFRQHRISVVPRWQDKSVILASRVMTELDADPGEQEATLDTFIREKRPMQLELDIIVRLATIDNYQGEEAPIVIFSAVRSNRDGNIGFLSNENRINVAISRARNGFFVLGNAQIICAKSSFWSKVTDIMKAHGVFDGGFHAICKKHQDAHVIVRGATKGCFKTATENGRYHECAQCVMDAASRQGRLKR